MGWGGEQNRERLDAVSFLVRSRDWTGHHFFSDRVATNRLQKNHRHVDRCFDKPALSNVRYSKPTPVFLYFIFWPYSSIPKSLVYLAFLSLSKWPCLLFQRKKQKPGGQNSFKFVYIPLPRFPFSKKKKCIFTTFITVRERSSFHLRSVPTPAH